jgi:hypothetical protein
MRAGGLALYWRHATTERRPDADAVLVGHSGLLDLLAKAHVDEAEMAAFRPLGAGRCAFLGRIRAGHWQGLSAP